VDANDQFIDGTQPVDAWLAQHAYEYGFAQSYHAETEALTGYIDEPWHFRYLGVKAAGRLHQVETLAGRVISTHEFIASLSCLSNDDLSALATEDAADAAQAGAALCQEYSWLSTCQANQNLLSCVRPDADLVACSNGCTRKPVGQADICAP